jgi:regulator of protease activity HflC (stomatin/prohibitin superfamily)
MGEFGTKIIEFLSQFFEYIKPWVVIEQFEMGVLLRKGKYKSTLSPGWYLKWPFLDYTYSTIVSTDTIEIANVNITSLDGQTISTGFVVEYTIRDVKKFLIDTNDAKSNMKDLAKGVVSNHLEDVNWEDIRKKTTINAIKRKLSAKYEELGVSVKDVLFTDKCRSRAFKLFNNAI